MAENPNPLGALWCIIGEKRGSRGLAGIAPVFSCKFFFLFELFSSIWFMFLCIFVGNQLKSVFVLDLFFKCGGEGVI